MPPKLTEGQGSLLDEHPSTLLDELEPYERRVSLRFNEAVGAALDAANAVLADPDSLQAFTGSIRQGVSANLCEALVGLGGESGNSFEISHSFALSRPVRASLAPVRFRRDHLPVLRAAAQELRERVPEEDVRVTGHFVGLHREASVSGEVSIAGTVEDDDRLRHIWIDLDADTYERATVAHAKSSVVTVRGDLIRRGTRSYLERFPKPARRRISRAPM